MTDPKKVEIILFIFYLVFIRYDLFFLLINTLLILLILCNIWKYTKFFDLYGVDAGHIFQ